MKALALICTLPMILGCVERKPFPKSRFAEIAKRCGYTEVRYIPRKSLLWADEPLIDFSGERDPEKAIVCFDQTDLELSKEHTTEEELKVAYIWEVRA